jgi:hypothetical protein
LFGAYVFKISRKIMVNIMYVKNKKSRSIVASHIIAQGGRGSGKYFMERRSPVAKIIGPLGPRIQWPDNRTLLSETGGASNAYKA